MTALATPISIQMHTTIQEILTRHIGVAGALLPILHDIQDALGYIPPDAVETIAEAQNLSRAEVHGVITYYHHFRSAPVGRNIVQICRAEACQAMGAEALLAHAETQLGCKAHHTTPDGCFTLQAAYCLGLCASSPSIMINDTVHARVTHQVFDALMTEARENV